MGFKTQPAGYRPGSALSVDCAVLTQPWIDDAITGVRHGAVPSATVGGHIAVSAALVAGLSGPGIHDAVAATCRLAIGSASVRFVEVVVGAVVANVWRADRPVAAPPIWRACLVVRRAAKASPWLTTSLLGQNRGARLSSRSLVLVNKVRDPIEESTVERVSRPRGKRIGARPLRAQRAFTLTLHTCRSGSTSLGTMPPKNFVPSERPADKHYKPRSPAKLPIFTLLT